MKVITNPRKSIAHRLEEILHEVYSRSIYKRMIDDITRPVKHNASEFNLVKPETVGSKKKNTVEKDINDDMPSMLFI
jgi:hypothetical protein